MLNRQEQKDILHWYCQKNLSFKDIKRVSYGAMFCVYHPSKIDIEEWTELYYLFDQYNNFLKLNNSLFQYMIEEKDWLYDHCDGGFCWYWFIGSGKQFGEESNFYFDKKNYFWKGPFCGKI